MAKPITLRYCFTFPDREDEVVEIQLDGGSLALLSPEVEEPPEWTDLDFHKCSHCPLESDSSPQCPAAAGIVPIVEAFDGVMSHTRCAVTVESSERTISGDRLDVQKGLGSLIGLVLATSGCPYMAPLRPMARFHLPLASPEETIYRATSMYLLAQFMRERAGLDPDWSLDGLTQLYTDIKVVNRFLSKRLNSVVATDSSVNAVVSLDVLAVFLPMAIDTSLESFKPYFERWLEPDPQESDGSAES